MHDTATETTWTAPGEIQCTAIHTTTNRGFMWRLERGPATLRGRAWRHLRDCRNACANAKPQPRVCDCCDGAEANRTDYAGPVYMDIDEDGDPIGPSIGWCCCEECAQELRDHERASIENDRESGRDYADTYGGPGESW